MDGHGGGVLDGLEGAGGGGDAHLAGVKVLLELGLGGGDVGGVGHVGLGGGDGGIVSEVLWNWRWDELKTQLTLYKMLETAYQVTKYK